MEIAKLSITTIDYVIENIATEDQKPKLLALKEQIKVAKPEKAEKEKVDTLEKLVNCHSGKTIDYGDMPDNLRDWRDCLYDYEKGVSTSLDAQLENFSEELDEEEFEQIWDTEKKTYKYDELEKVLEDHYPGIVKYLVDNKITEIRFYW
jgi:hypothetical protein